MDIYKKNIKTRQRIEYGIYQFLEHFFGKKRVSRILGNRKRTFYKKLGETLAKSGEGQVISIERRKNLTIEEFNEQYRDKGKPVIFEGAANDWDCVKKWSLEYFKELHGEDEVLLVERKDFEIITLANIIDNIRSGGKKYFRFYPLLHRHPEHLQEFDYQWLKKSKNFFSIGEVFRAFIGGKDTFTPFHSENSCNMFVQVHGQKKWSLIPPYYNAVLDPNPTFELYRQTSVKSKDLPFDPFNPDYTPPFTLFRYIDRFETTLNQGDILWVPPFYWHSVINTSDSIGVGFRWFSPITGFKIAPLCMFLDFFARKPPIWKLLKLAKEDANLIFLKQRGQLEKYKKESQERSAAASRVKVNETLK